MDRLSRLSGQDRAKQQVQDLMSRVQVRARREAEGLPNPPWNPNVVFQGNPGTGKTTMAGIIGQMYAALGVTDSAKVTSVRGVDLISEYQNGTPERVKEIWSRAKGGVLFIDEAYGLVTDRDNASGKQAVDTLTGLIENGGDGTVVILAGYPGRLKEVFDLNEGMARRFPTTVDFTDFSFDQRVGIMRGLMDDARMTFAGGSGAADAMRDALYDTGSGNAGDVQNLWDKVVQAHNVRVAPLLAGASGRQAERLLRQVTLDDVRAGHERFLAESRVEAPLRLAAVPTGVRKPAAKKSTAKKPVAKKAAVKKPAAKKIAVKKPS